MALQPGRAPRARLWAATVQWKMRRTRRSSLSNRLKVSYQSHCCSRCLPAVYPECFSQRFERLKFEEFLRLGSGWVRIAILLQKYLHHCPRTSRRGRVERRRGSLFPETPRHLPERPRHIVFPDLVVKANL